MDLQTPTLTDTHKCTLLKGDLDLGNRVESGRLTLSWQFCLLAVASIMFL